VCYYDRRQDPQNTVIDRYCSVSQNQGASWQNTGCRRKLDPGACVR